MNTFLQGCCYIPPDDDNVPSIFESSTYATLSSTTNMSNPMNSTYKSSNYLQLKHSVKEDDMSQFKRASKARSAKSSVKSSHNSINNSFTKMDAGCNNNISSASEEIKKNYEHAVNLNTVIPTVSKNPSVQSSSYTSSYELKSPQIPSSSKNQLLDRLSACLWKCSLGCQQIPTLNT